tara:strand:+ start:12996 stop:13217 length:222 start_codon:yes stop_codon:yes gene_type:complete
LLSCNNSKRNYNDFEIIIEKKRIDSIYFEAKVIVRDNSRKKNKDEIFILNGTEVELNTKVRILKEKFLQNKVY